MTLHIVMEENAALIAKWLRERGGIAIWHSANLSNPGMSWTTPKLTEDGQPMPKPTWQAENAPERLITDPAEVLVQTGREVKRFHVFRYGITSGVQRRIAQDPGRREQSRAGIVARIRLWGAGRGYLRSGVVGAVAGVAGEAIANGGGTGMTFRLQITLGNSAMSSAGDVGHALRELGTKITSGAVNLADCTGRIADGNGNTVGHWHLLPERK